MKRALSIVALLLLAVSASAQPRTVDLVVRNGTVVTVDAGKRVITDSRGLPIDASTPMRAGSILRLVSRRDRASSGDEASE